MALESDFAKEFENFRNRFLELEEKSKRDEVRCLMLETEVENLKKKNQELEGKIAMIQKVVVDSTCMESDSEKLLDLMVENKVLECEKAKAESDVSFWKEKVKELESNIKVTNEKVKEDVNVASRGFKDAFHSQVRKQLLFEEDGCPSKKMAPSTPGVGQSPFHGVIDISDEDVDYNEVPQVKKVSGSSKRDGLAKSHSSNLENIDEEDTDEFKVHSSNARSGKRKRVAKIIASDDEDSDDDNAPICTLKTQHSSGVKENVSRRYLTRLRKLETENKQGETIYNLNKTVSSSEDEEDYDGVDESESEGQSLGGFIVDSSESVTDGDSERGDSSDESEDALNEYKVTLEKIGRKKISNLKWDLEGDMLSDFGKDPVLCMRAVCALYRQQTADEKASKETIYHNERGFSQTDAPRASKLAEFLTDGDPDGDLNKTVEELKEYDSKGIKLCRALAAKYSKQLFTIYQKKEDPYFLPQ